MKKLASSLTIFLYSCILYVFFGNLSSTVYAQFPHYFNYNNENKLPTNEIYSILQDQKGYIWIGSDAGIYQFDGLQFRAYSSSKLNSLSATGLTQTASGTIYAYNFNGQLLQINNGKLNVVHSSQVKMNGIVQDGKNIWLTSEKGIVSWDEKQKKFKARIPQKLYSANQFTSAPFRYQNKLYFFNSGNVIEVKKGKVKIFKLPLQQQHIPIYFFEYKKSLYAIKQTGDELFRFTGKQFIRIQINYIQNLLKGRKITNIQQTDKHTIWFSTFSGIIRVQTTLQKANLFWPELAFSNCLQDRNGANWFTTLNNGILYVKQLQQTVWTSDYHLFQHNQLTHITGNEDKFCAVNSSGELLYFQPKIGLKTFRLPNIADVGMFIYDAIDKCYYFNQNAQLIRFDGEKLSVINQQFRPAKAFLHFKNQYIIASSQGLYVLDKLTDETIHQPIYSAWCRALLQPSFNQDLWVATNDGLAIFKFKSGKFILNREVLKDIQILSIVELNNKVYVLDFKGNLYVLSADLHIKKVLQFENTRVTQLKVIDHQIIACSNQGLLIVHPFQRTIRQFKQEHGLLSSSIRSLYSFYHQLYIATNKGVQSVALADLIQQRNQNNLYLHEIRINREKISSNKNIQLKYNDLLDIKLDGLSYHSLDNYTWEYRFNEENWTTLQGKTNHLEFQHLASGESELSIRLVDAYGQASTKIIQLHLNIEAPYYQKTWFYMLLILSVGGISFWIYRKRLTILKIQQTKELQRIQLESDLRWSQQNALKAQMNPHFLFNVLHSIKGYIYENDKKNAIKYLTEFSTLVRDVLENSGVPFISLEKEIEFLTVYIDLESMLLEGDFQFNLHIDEELDTDFIQVPSMILQPFIENAFKHGLRYIKSEKRLNLSVLSIPNSDFIQLIIEDNGIGLTSSKEMKKEQHRSFASGAIEERIRLLNLEHPNMIQIESSDLSEVGKIGTQIIVRLKIAQ